MRALDPPRDSPTRSERTVAVTLMLMALALRLVCVFRYRIDSDEPQHLHVVWSIAKGLVPYRDVFDNHTPLFHLLYAPLAAAIGENPRIVLLMRLGVAPLYFIALWVNYQIGRSLFSPRVGLWATLFTALLPIFFLTTLEFRADDLWVTLWLLGLLVFVRGSGNPRHYIVTGILLGSALAASFKTVLLLATLVLGVSAAAASTTGDRKGTAKALYASLCLALGFCLPLALLLLFFERMGALQALYDCVVVHNSRAATVARTSVFDVSMALTLIPIGVLMVRAMAASPANVGTRRRRIALFVAHVVYLIVIWTVWPVVDPQDYLPMLPVAGIFLTPLLLEFVTDLRLARPLSAGWSLLAIIGVVEIVCVGWRAAPWNDATKREVRFLRDVRRLTRWGDFVMDTKGEAIFRSRPFYPALDVITQEQLRRGEIEDDISEKLIASLTHVAVTDSRRLPIRARDFLDRNYLPVGSLRVAGKVLQPAPPRTPLRFEIEVPGEYSVVTEHGFADGLLDGESCAGGRFLSRGSHSFESFEDQGVVALLWANAASLGYRSVDPRAPACRFGRPAVGRIENGKRAKLRRS